MPQKYTVGLMAGNKLKHDLRKIYIRVTGSGMNIKIPTNVKVTETQFNGKEIINHPLKSDYNTTIKNDMLRVESLVHEAHVKGIDITPEFLSGGSSKTVKEFADWFVKEVSNSNTRRTLKCILNKLPDMPLSEVTKTYLPNFKSKISKLDQNTIHTQTKKAKQLLLAAIKKDYITDPKTIKAIQDFSPPPYKQKLPEYLTESEINDFFEVVRTLKNEAKKTSGYYFLLSCFTGYRLSDLKRFKYEDAQKDGKLILRAKKNGSIVSIPIYSRLSEVLEYVKEHPLKITEQHFRLFVKNIATDIGINQKKRNITIHSGRHAFSMMLMEKGFSLEDVAAMIGDSVNVAKVYARISNKRLEAQVMERLG